MALLSIGYVVDSPTGSTPIGALDEKGAHALASRLQEHARRTRGGDDTNASRDFKAWTMGNRVQVVEPASVYDVDAPGRTKVAQGWVVRATADVLARVHAAAYDSADKYDASAAIIKAPGGAADLYCVLFSAVALTESPVMELGALGIAALGVKRLPSTKLIDEANGAAKEFAAWLRKVGLEPMVLTQATRAEHNARVGVMCDPQDRMALLHKALAFSKRHGIQNANMDSGQGTDSLFFNFPAVPRNPVNDAAGPVATNDGDSDVEGVGRSSFFGTFPAPTRPDFAFLGTIPVVVGRAGGRRRSGGGRRRSGARMQSSMGRSSMGRSGMGMGSRSQQASQSYGGGSDSGGGGGGGSYGGGDSGGGSSYEPAYESYVEPAAPQVVYVLPAEPAAPTRFAFLGSIPVSVGGGMSRPTSSQSAAAYRAAAQRASARRAAQARSTYQQPGGRLAQASMRPQDYAMQQSYMSPTQYRALQQSTQSTAAPQVIVVEREAEPAYDPYLDPYAIDPYAIDPYGTPSPRTIVVQADPYKPYDSEFYGASAFQPIMPVLL
jgi:hypothetical protein